MNRYFIYLAYDGTNYHGWQIQPDRNSVQAELNRALSTIYQQELTVVGAGRTDTGVHATVMVAHFDFEDDVDCVQLTYKLNRFLPRDISIYKVCPVVPEAHARFDATSRTYKYYVTSVKYPFNRQYSCRVYSELDYERMEEAAQTLFDYTDFTSFSKLHTDVKTNNCKIMQANWVQQDEITWVFTIQADRFLRNMVRAIVGTLLEVGRHKMTVAQFRQVIESMDRCAAGTSAPANALFLVDVTYPDTLFLDTN